MTTAAVTEAARRMEESITGKPLSEHGPASGYTVGSSYRPSEIKYDDSGMEEEKVPDSTALGTTADTVQEDELVDPLTRKAREIKQRRQSLSGSPAFAGRQLSGNMPSPALSGRALPSPQTSGRAIPSPQLSARALPQGGLGSTGLGEAGAIGAAGIAGAAGAAGIAGVGAGVREEPELKPGMQQQPIQLQVVPESQAMPQLTQMGPPEIQHHNPSEVSLAYVPLPETSEYPAEQLEQLQEPTTRSPLRPIRPFEPQEQFMQNEERPEVSTGSMPYSTNQPDRDQHQMPIQMIDVETAGAGMTGETGGLMEGAGESGITQPPLSRRITHPESNLPSTEGYQRNISPIPQNSSTVGLLGSIYTPTSNITGQNLDLSSNDQVENIRPELESRRHMQTWY